VALGCLCISHLTIKAIKLQPNLRASITIPMLGINLL